MDKVKIYFNNGEKQDEVILELSEDVKEARKEIQNWFNKRGLTVKEHYISSEELN